MTSFYATLSSGKSQWYDDAELNTFVTSQDQNVHATQPEKRDAAVPELPSAGYQQLAQPAVAPPAREETSTRVVPAAGRGVAASGGGGGRQAEDATSSAGNGSFYGKKGPGTMFRTPRPARSAPSEGPRREQAMAIREEEANTPGLPGSSLSVLPKRPVRDAACHALDKEIAAAKTPAEAFAVAFRDTATMDAANWANLVYALAHLHKHARDGNGNAQRVASSDPSWMRTSRALHSNLAELTARDTSNVLWSMATLALKKEPLFLECADALGKKLAVCDPISVSKAAWAMTSVENRDKRLELFTQLAVPVVLRAEVFPIGALTMTCYAFAKAAHRDANVYEALSSSIARYGKEDLRPIDVCNVVWAFCTVGYRDDHLFTRICEEHLTDAAALENYNPQDLSNTAWGFSKVVFVHAPAMQALALQALKQRHTFKPIHITNFFYSFATMRLRGPDGFLASMAESAVSTITAFDSANLSIAVWSLAMLLERNALLDGALRVTQQPDVARTLTSRTLSMLFLSCFRFGRIADADAVFDAAVACGTPIGASGFSAVLMTGEQGPDPSRELRLQQALAREAADDRMNACITNAAAIRLLKRGLPAEAKRLLLETRAANPKSWSAVSARLLSQMLAGSDAIALSQGTKEIWEKPVNSGIHPIAATRQNEGPHAYTREFMTLQAVLCGAPEGDVDACMTAVEQFAESRSLWLKITAWEKAVVVHEVARLNRPGVVVEIGAYVGYSAMNLARAVRPHGGRVASIEVDPVHVTIVRNMVEYAGLTDTVDVWTGYCYDVFPHLLEQYGPRSVGMVFMDQKGTRFHTDLGRLEELDLLAEGAVILADNVLKPGAPLYIHQLAKGPFTDLTAVSVREFLLQSEDWMVLGFHDPSRGRTPEPPPELHRLAFESDAFRKRSMFDSVAPSKADWWAFSQRFVDGLEYSGCKPRIVGLHGRDNPVIQPADVAAIFERAGRLPPSG